MTTAGLHIVADEEELAVRVARDVALLLGAAAGQQGWASIVLAGGRTPRRLYQCLAARHRHDVPWDRIHFYWGDERHVPYDDARSNYRMAREALFDALPVRLEQVYPMPTALPGEQAAQAYEQTLRSRFTTDWPTFDLVLLGVGEDGHTASLFPGSAALDERSRWVTATVAPVEPRERLTLTIPALTHARSIFVLATGPGKANAAHCGLSDRSDPRCPVSLLSTTRGHLIWWLDRAAAAKVRSKPGTGH